MRTISYIILSFIVIASATGCYYDKEEILYPDSACDTTNVRYSTSVAPIISANCNSCHSGSSPSGGFNLDTYVALKVQADNQKLLKAINHEAGVSPMPKNASKLSNCNIAIITQWVAAGTPQN